MTKEETKKKKETRVKDCPLKMTDMDFSDHLKGKKEAHINIELQVKGEDANTLIALVNLAHDDTHLEDLLEVTFKAGLTFCAENMRKGLQT